MLSKRLCKSLESERVAVGIDVRDGLVHVQGWKENSGISAMDLAMQMRTLDLRTVIFTDISRDGLGSGLNISATRELAEAEWIRRDCLGRRAYIEGCHGSARCRSSGCDHRAGII